MLIGLTTRVVSVSHALLVLAICFSVTVPGQCADIADAKELCDSGLYEQAIESYRQGSERARSNVDRASIGRLTEACMNQLVRSKGGRKRLHDIADTSVAPSISAKALLVLATDYYWEKEECSKALPLYERVETEYQRTDEAARASIAKSVNCLVAVGEDEAAVRELTRIAHDASGSIQGAYALYELGVLYKWREERRKARETFMALIGGYSPDLEYPYPGGQQIVKSAQFHMRALDAYRLGPHLDSLMFKLKRWCGLARSPTASISSWKTLAFDGAFDFGIRSVSILFVYSLLALSWLTGVRARSVEQESDLFKKHWSLGSIFVLLVVIAAVQSWAQILYVCIAEKCVIQEQVGPTGAFAALVQVCLSTGIMLVASSWGQSLGTIFSVRKESVGCIAKMIGCAGVAYVSIAFSIFRLSAVVSHSASRPVIWGQSALILEGIGTRVGMSLVTVCLVPFAEEMIFRGLVFETLRRRCNGPMAAILSSLLFGTAHLEPVGGMMVGFMFGMIAIYLRYRFRSLTPSSVFHLLVNLPFGLWSVV